MPRSRTEYVCQSCGGRTPKWLGRCPECGDWNTLLETVAPATSPGARRGSKDSASASRPVSAVSLADLDSADFERVEVPMPELSRVLGGGVVRGSVTLIGGDPGVGKSTLLLQVADLLARTSPPVLYVSGEESLAQVGMRARRLGLATAALRLCAENDLDSVERLIDQLSPTVAVVDSIQSVYLSDIESTPGSVTQLRECTLRLTQQAKRSGTAILLVGHVTKDGAIAGPRVLEHMVDTVLYLEGERFQNFRLLRGTKNRFGSTHEVGVFEMRQDGLAEVSNPSAAFLAERGLAGPGSAVTVTMEGSRPLLVEVQALVSKTALPVPRRTSNGYDTNRLLMLTAVLTRRLGVRLAEQDLFVNVVGGLRLEEPSVDLSVALAILSSHRDQPLDQALVCVGEIGLSGEIRGGQQLSVRLREAAKLGFHKAIVPRASIARHEPLEGMDVIPAASLREAVNAAFG